MLLESGVVHENVQLAVRLDRPGDCVLAEGRLAHVAGQQQRFAPFRLDGLPRFLGVALFFRQVHERHVGAFAGKEHGHSPADARIAAGNEGRFVLELLRTSIERRLVMRPGLQLRFQARRLLVLLRKRRLWLLLRSLGLGLLVGR